MSWVQTWSSAKQCWLTNFCGSTVLPCQKCCATWTGIQCGNAVAAANWRWHVANAGITATENHGPCSLDPCFVNPALSATVLEHPLPPGCLPGACAIRSFLQMPELSPEPISTIYWRTVQLHVMERLVAWACLDTAWTFEDHTLSPLPLCRDNSWKCNLLRKPPCAYGTRTCSSTEPLRRQTCPQPSQRNMGIFPKALPKPWLEPSPSSGSPTDITGCTGYTAQTTAHFLWEGALFGWTSSRCQPSPCPLNISSYLYNCTSNCKTVSSGCGWSGRCQYTPSFGKRYGTPRHNAMTTRMYKLWRCDEVWESKYLTANHSKPRRFRSQQWFVQGRRSNSALPTWYRDQRRFYCRICRILCCRTATSGE